MYTDKNDLDQIKRIWMYNFSDGEEEGRNSVPLFANKTRLALRQNGYSLSRLQDTLTSMEMRKDELTNDEQDFFDFYRDVQVEGKMELIHRASMDTKGVVFLLKALHGLQDKEVIQIEDTSLSDVIGDAYNED